MLGSNTADNEALWGRTGDNKEAGKRQQDDVDEHMVLNILLIEGSNIPYLIIKLSILMVYTRVHLRKQSIC